MGVKSWKEELEKERVKAKAMKREFCCVGLGYEARNSRAPCSLTPGGSRCGSRTPGSG